MLLAIWYTGLLYLALILLVTLLVVALVAGYELLRRDFRRFLQSNDTVKHLDQSERIKQQLAALKEEIESTSQANQKELGRLWRKTDESLHERLARTGDAVGQVRQSLGAIKEASEKIFQIGSQLTELSDALRMPPPGSAGGGELWLADLLGQMLPPQHYQLNAALGNGRPADAVVRLANFLVAIDAGFPISAVPRPPAAGKGGPARQDLKALEQAARRHIDRVAAECIRPENGTVDFALMYLPTEGLYYDLIIRNSGRADSVSSYALSRRVIAVSPNTLYAYLYTIVLGLRGLQIEAHAGKMLARLAEMREDFSRFQAAFAGLGVHLDRASGKYEQAGRQLNRYADRLADALPPGRSFPQLARPDEPAEQAAAPAAEGELIFPMPPPADAAWQATPTQSEPAAASLPLAAATPVAAAGPVLAPPQAAGPAVVAPQVAAPAAEAEPPPLASQAAEPLAAEAKPPSTPAEARPLAAGTRSNSPRRRRRR